MATLSKDRRPLAVMMSKRANIFYLEYVRLIQKDSRLMYLTQTMQPIEKIVNIPDKNTAFILLGKGSSITDSAIRMLAESNVMVGFCGSGGSPLHAVMDPVFLTPQDEYRPTEYFQKWAKLWFDEPTRLELAKDFLRQRVFWDAKAFEEILNPLQFNPTLDRLLLEVDSCNSTMTLLAAEGRFIKSIYKIFADKYKISFSRDHQGEKVDVKQNDKKHEKINSFLSHGNYIAYGMAATALHVLGISFAFPLLHGKTRRGALVFDVADLIKDWIVVPIAFECGARNAKDNEFRAKLIQSMMDHKVLDKLFDFIKELIEKHHLNQQVGSALKK